MVTRTEALIEALEKVDDSVTGTGNRIESAIQILEESGSEHSSVIREALESHGQAAENLGRDIKKSGANIEVGLIVSSVLLAGAYFFSTILTRINERSIANKQFVQMFDLVVCLFEKYESELSYEFVLERSYAEDTTTEERQTLLNGLIHYGVIEDNYDGEADMLYLDPSSPHILELYDYLEEYGLIVFQECSNSIINDP